MLSLLAFSFNSASTGSLYAYNLAAARSPVPVRDPDFDKGLPLTSHSHRIESAEFPFSTMPLAGRSLSEEDLLKKEPLFIRDLRLDSGSGRIPASPVAANPSATTASPRSRAPRSVGPRPVGMRSTSSFCGQDTR